jgi:hypothetical protein
LTELFAESKPHLEQALGARLDFAPRFKPVTTAELAGMAEPELEAHVHWHFPQLHGATLTRTMQFALQIVASATVAHYLERGDEIVVAAENLPKIATWDDTLTGANSEAFLQLCLVHEVVRCHLDRRYQLARLRAGCHDAEEFDTLLALVEGEAQALTQHVASKLGSAAIFPLLARRYLHVPDQAPDPSIKAVSQTALHGRYRACVQGKDFFERLEMFAERRAFRATAGAAPVEIEQLVFAHLPRQLTVIAKPDRWQQGVSASQPDLAVALAPLQRILPASEWQSLQQTWTPAMLVQVTNMLGAPAERAERVARTWYEGRSLVWTNRKQPGRQVALTVVRHDNEAGARAYFGFAVDLQRQQDTLPPGTCGPAIQIVESKSTSVHLDGFDEAVRNDKKTVYGNMEPIPVSLLLARAGDLVIECTWHGQEADRELASNLVQGVRANSSAVTPSTR